MIEQNTQCTHIISEDNSMIWCLQARTAKMFYHFHVNIMTRNIIFIAVHILPDIQLHHSTENKTGFNKY